MARVVNETWECLRKSDWKQDGANFIRPYGGFEEDVVGKQYDAERISIRRWTWECKPWGLVEENGGTPQVS